MTDRVLSTRSRRAAYAQETEEVFIVLVTLTNSNWEDDVRISTDPSQLLPIAQIRGTISNGKEYVFCPFDISLPGENDEGSGVARISIDAIDRRIIQLIRSASRNIGITIQVVLESAPNAPQLTVTNFRLDKIEYDAMSVSAEISSGFLDNEPFPYQRFVKSKYPGMF